MYSSCFEIFVTQHDVLRDLALHLSNQGLINERPRLLMPRREKELPKEWGRNSDQPFNAQIVSIHTGIIITPSKLPFFLAKKIRLVGSLSKQELEYKRSMHLNFVVLL